MRLVCLYTLKSLSLPKRLFRIAALATRSLFLIRSYPHALQQTEEQRIPFGRGEIFYFRRIESLGLTGEVVTMAWRMSAREMARQAHGNRAIPDGPTAVQSVSAWAASASVSRCGSLFSRPCRLLKAGQKPSSPLQTFVADANLTPTDATNSRLAAKLKLPPLLVALHTNSERVTFS